ncbi:MAG TPA: hypothetical protein VHW67_06340 [Solirubrobacteraceae bacterium]|jgi:hypothetical protein|nr:hypothetical protein [Solirubrobacteraceae bacterium]
MLGLAVICLPSVASAAPTVTFKAKAIPIPGYRGTGNILGAGAALQVQYAIKGTEYGGYPPPLVGINFYTPAGTKIERKGFAVCRPSALQNMGPAACPKRSKVTLSGTALGVVSFGTERVEERASIQAFFAPGGALEFYTAGSSPVSLEFLSPSHVASAPGPYAQKFVTAVPLIETVPGAPDASALSIEVKIGAAMRKGKRVIYYGRVPKRCPRGGFPLKSELLFAGFGEVPAQTVPVTYKAPCPRGHARKARQSRRRHKAAPKHGHKAKPRHARGAGSKQASKQR